MTLRLSLAQDKRVLEMMAVVGIILAVSSLSLPWFKLDFTGYTDRLEGGLYKGEYTCYPNFFVFDDLGYSTSPHYQPWDGGISEYRTLMTIEASLVGLMALTSLLFLGALLYDRRSASIVIGALSAGTAIAAAAYFALKVGDAVSIYQLSPSGPDIPNGFISSGTDIGGTDWSWGPATGWVLMAVSASITSVTAALQALVVHKGTMSSECGEDDKSPSKPSSENR